MQSSMLIALQLAAVLCSAAFVLGDGSFDPNRVRYIDTFAGNEAPNFLFRGNLPVSSDHKFVYDQLKTLLPQLAAKANTTLSEDFFLSVVSFLNPTEIVDEEIEKEWIKNNPTLAEYINWPIVGDLSEPDHLSEEVRHKLALSLDSWQIDKLPTKMQLLKQLLQSPAGNKTQSRVIYMHCEAGMDRTGEMSGSYYMFAQNTTFLDALAYDETIEPRNISIYSQNAFQWYCYNLFYTSQPWQECSLK